VRHECDIEGNETGPARYKTRLVSADPVNQEESLIMDEGLREAIARSSPDAKRQAFDSAEWQKIAEEIETAVLVGPQKVGREYSFSGFRVPGSWRGSRSGVQILPPPPEAPRAPVEMADHPFILEFPIVGAPVELRPITNHRRIREHRRLTLLLNVLLTADISFLPPRLQHFWAHIPPVEGIGGDGESRWLQ
jgi:hypothetical protein